MALEFFDHTADVGVHISGSSLDELFAEAARAFALTVIEPDDLDSTRTRHLTLRSADLDQLLVDWLSELVGLFDIEQFLPRTAAVAVGQTDSGWRLEATARGDLYDPARHTLKVLVKGVTYHDLHIARTPAGRWETRIVFDI